MTPGQQLTTWCDDGTLERVADACRHRTPVQIKRSSGEFVTGIIASCGGFGGLMCVVAWGPNTNEITYGADRVNFPDGVQGKGVDTSQLIEWNPWLAGTA